MTMNNATPLNLEFIQILLSVHFVSRLLCPFEPLYKPTKYPGIRQPRKRKPTNSYVRIYKQIMQNKPNVKLAHIDIITYIAMRYEIMDNWLFRKTNPIAKRAKNDAKCVFTKDYEERY